MITMRLRILHGNRQVDDILVNVDHKNRPNVQVYHQQSTVYAFTDEGIKKYDDVKEITLSFED